MIRVMRSEWIKTSTVMAHRILALIALFFPIVVGVLTSVFGDFTGGLESIEIAEFVLGVSVVSTMVLGVIAVVSLTSEYTHNTIRPTYAATPRRVRVLAGKWLVSTIVTFVLSLATVSITWLTMSLILSGRGHPISLGDDKVLVVLISAVVLSVLVTWFGFGIGLVIRNSPASVSLLLLWPLLIEGLIRLVCNLIGAEGAGNWVPYQAAIAASAAEPGVDELGRPLGQIWFATVGLAVVAVGVILDRRRDA